KRPRWSGTPRPLSYDLCQAMRRVLVSDAVDPSWSQRGQRVLATMRAEHAFLDDSPAPLIAGSKEITWWTFAGGAANLLLARVLESVVGARTVVRNTSVTFAE